MSSCKRTQEISFDLNTSKEPVFYMGKQLAISHQPIKMGSKFNENYMKNFEDMIKPPPSMVCRNWNPWIPNQVEPRLTPIELQNKVGANI